MRTFLFVLFWLALLGLFYLGASSLLSERHKSIIPEKHLRRFA